jgi:hypothetical protein
LGRGTWATSWSFPFLASFLTRSTDFFFGIASSATGGAAFFLVVDFVFREGFALGMLNVEQRYMQVSDYQRGSLEVWTIADDKFHTSLQDWKLSLRAKHHAAAISETKT